MNQKAKVLTIISVLALVVLLMFTARNVNPLLFSRLKGVTLKSTENDIGSSFQAESRGCSNIFVYKTNSDNTLGLSVSADKDRLGLSTTNKTYVVGGTDGLIVQLLMGKDVAFYYCNDVGDPDRPEPKELIGKSGKVVINISEIDETRPIWDRDYAATAILENVRFIEENGSASDIIINKLIFDNVRVGRLVPR